MALELGDYNVYASDAVVLTYESDGSGSAGDAVNVNGSDQVTPTDASGDDIFGVLAEDSPSAGEEVAVVKYGDVIVNSGGSVTAGDIVQTSSTAGQVAQNDNGKEATGGSFTGTFAPANPEALVDSGGTLPDGTSLGTNAAVVYLK